MSRFESGDPHQFQKEFMIKLFEAYDGTFCQVCWINIVKNATQEERALWKNGTDDLSIARAKMKGKTAVMLYCREAGIMIEGVFCVEHALPYVRKMKQHLDESLIKLEQENNLK